MRRSNNVSQVSMSSNDGRTHSKSVTLSRVQQSALIGSESPGRRSNFKRGTNPSPFGASISLRILGWSWAYETNNRTAVAYSRWSAISLMNNNKLRCQIIGDVVLTHGTLSLPSSRAMDLASPIAVFLTVQDKVDEEIGKRQPVTWEKDCSGLRRKRMPVIQQQGYRCC